MGRPQQHSDETATLRLNKYLAQAGVASRRAADELIRSGVVTVNGLVVSELGARVCPDQDRVAVRGRAVRLAPEQEHLLLALHKPVQVVSTAKDPERRRTVLDLLPPDMRSRRPVPVGRLDYLSEGLILLTTDGELCLRLTHPRWHLAKTYEVTVKGAVPEAALDAMRHGMTLAEGEELAPVEARRISQSRDRSVIELVLRQGVNRQIRRMFRDLSLTVLRLRRLGHGPVRLGNLAQGAFRPLTPSERKSLYDAVGLTK